MQVIHFMRPKFRTLHVFLGLWHFRCLPHTSLASFSAARCSQIKLCHANDLLANRGMPQATCHMRHATCYVPHPSQVYSSSKTCSARHLRLSFAVKLDAHATSVCHMPHATERSLLPADASGQLPDTGPGSLIDLN